MGSTPWVVTIVVAALGGSFLTEVFRWIVGRFRGRIEKRSEVERAWDRADEEARKRRLLEEHNSELRRILYAAPCVDSSTIPPFPSYSRRENTA